MTLARKYLIAPEDTPYYHVMNRCVQRAFLCGVDNSYEHRRRLIIERVKFLVSVFKFDPVKFSDAVQQSKDFIENIKQKSRQILA